MSFIPPFTQGADTVSISATTTSAATSFTAGYPSLLVTNAGTGLAFITVADSAAVATSAKLPILPGAASVIGITPTAASVAAITASGTATLYFTPGYGN